LCAYGALALTGLENYYGILTQPCVARPKKQDVLLELGYAHLTPLGMWIFLI
jgi:hypothetical protein